jgi:nicotinate dehydrogenase subunit B
VGADGRREAADQVSDPDISRNPGVVIDLLDRSEEVPWGGGEPTCAVILSAIAGVVFEATGVPIRSVPSTPTKILAALKAA